VIALELILMVVKVDLSHLPLNLKSTILSNQEFSSLPRDDRNGQNADVVVLEVPQEIKETIIKTIEKILSLSNAEGYSVVENMIDESEIAVLKSGDIEELGIFICAHCGAPFQNREQMMIHQRMHYIF
jgi:DNA-directed RNA polymerase